MNDIDYLLQFGLTTQESKVYLSLLRIGESSVQEIAKQARIQRTNCYAILDSLMQKGLVSYVTTKKGRRYIANDPSVLTRLHQERTVILGTLLPHLRDLYSQAPIRTKVQSYEGKEGIKQIYEEILQSNGYDCLYCPETLMPVWGDYSARFGIRASQKGLKIRELISTSERPVSYTKYFKKPLQEIRYLSHDIEVDTDIVLFDNKLVLVAYKPSLHGVVIEGSSIVETQRVLFEIAWKKASD